MHVPFSIKRKESNPLKKSKFSLENVTCILASIVSPAGTNESKVQTYFGNDLIKASALLV